MFPADKVSPLNTKMAECNFNFLIAYMLESFILSDVLFVDRVLYNNSSLSLFLY